MTKESTAHLVKMINQIAANCPCQDDPAAVTQATTNHIHKFWAHSMKEDIVAYLESGGEGLSPAAVEAIRALESSLKHIL
ncbi:formate dehydrogenase [Marinobacter sp. NP-4(2019)]|uniref:formate dehydrogenase subunit delta n=1 Tax=Marinobacter sp. NP-4(2019) TaxID=2488665 RepID=UPI000FC3F3B4|nr:formate dehydrogenase subunit delta [Marinobacter sp. NP-4(2019)]AZT84801.1 formate dehydrogenase [Marinobacter sp. NP-4(2019)]